MKKLVFLIVVSLLLLPGCDDKTQLKPLKNDAVILAFGDSLTYGTGGGEDGGYPEQLSAISGLQVINSGVAGEVSRDGLIRLSQVLDNIHPQLVILCHGGNDILRKMDSDELKNNLRGMIRLARDAGAEVVLVGVPRPGLLPKPPKLYEQLAEEWQTPFEGKILKDLLTTSKFKSDAVHLNAAGYRRLAEALALLLRDAGAL